MKAVGVLSSANWFGVAFLRLLRLFNPERMFNAAIDGARLLRRHRRLALAMAKRELTARYAGQALGSFWVIGHPLFQMFIFLFLFAIVFKVRINGSLEMPRDYTVYILSGLVPWLAILPVITAAPASILGNIALVKQFKFEVEVLPVKDVMIAMVFWVIGLVIIATYTFAIYLALPWTYLLLP